MATTITHTGGTITPTLVDGYSASVEPGNLVHLVPNRAAPDYALREAGLRTGELTLVFAGQAAAVAAFAALRVKQVLTLTSTDVPTISMSFIIFGGTLRLELDRTTRKAWTVIVPYQEVTP